MKMILLIFTFALFSCNVNTPEEEIGNIIASRQNNAEVSRDGEYICFHGNYLDEGGIHIIDKYGNYLRNIFPLEGSIYADFPTWGKDDLSMVFSIAGNLYSTDVFGNNLKQLTNTDDGFSCVSSPNGNLIAYTKTICDPECGIALYDFATDTTKLIKMYGGNPTWYKNSEVYSSTNIFIPVNGSNYRTTYEGFRINKTNVTTNKTDTVYVMNSPEYDVQGLSLSPDGNLLLITMVSGIQPQYNIWKLNLQDLKLKQLTYDGGSAPSWFPDGQKIVYTNTKLTEGGLWTMGLNGNNKTRLTKHQR